MLQPISRQRKHLSSDESLAFAGINIDQNNRDQPIKYAVRHKIEGFAQRSMVL
jgi:hypothetical protein